MRTILTGLLAVGVLLLPGCSKKKPDDLNQVTQADIAKPTAVISDAEVQQFAARTEQALKDNDATAFGRLLHLDGMYYRIFPKKKVDQHRQLKDAKGGWKRAVEQNVFNSLRTFHVSFLRVVRDDDGIKARFRLAGEGINYWDVLLDRNDAGRIGIVDFLDYLAGEYVTEGQRRIMQQVMPALLSGDRNEERTRNELHRVQRIASLSAMIRQGRHQEFLKEYNSLGEDLKKQRSIMHMRVMAANTVAVNNEEADVDVYTQAVDDYRREHSTAVNLELMLIDYYFLEEKYEDALSAMDGLDKRVGGDPYLDLLKGNAHYAAGDPAKAKALLAKVMKTFPWEPASYQTLAVIEAAAEDYEAVTRLLIVGEKDAGIQWALESAKEFDGYRDSPEFADWAKTRK